MTQTQEILDLCENIVGRYEKNYYQVYLFGSRVYGTHRADSDYDVRLIAPFPFDGNKEEMYKKVDITMIPLRIFTESVIDCKIDALEILYTPEDFRLYKKYKPIDKSKYIENLSYLRREVSAKADNSWVKCKKKLIDGENLIGLKSLFHAFRIVDFGTQIAKHGIIENYASSNYIWERLYTLYLCGNYNWNSLTAEFKGNFNKAKTEFRKVAPKE